MTDSVVVTHIRESYTSQHKGGTKYRALELAAYLDNVEAARLILEAGAAVDPRDEVHMIHILQCSIMIDHITIYDH